MVLTVQSTFWACWGVIFTLALVLLGVGGIRATSPHGPAWDCIGLGVGLLLVLGAVAWVATGRVC
jgi:uncharacterized membrane protein